MAALKTLIGFPDDQCLVQYQLGFQFAAREVDWAAVEQNVIDHYEDPKVRPVLIGLINQSHPYHTRALFNLMSATIRDPATPKTQRNNMAWAITQTDLPVDDDLFALLRSLPPDTTGNDAAGQLIRYFGERKYEPLVAYLRPIVPTAPTGALWNHCNALVRIGTEESLAVALTCIGRLSAENKDVGSTIGYLTELPATTPLSLPALKGVLIEPLGRLESIAYIRLIGHRHDPTGIPDLLAYLQTDPKGAGGPYDTPHYRALEALLDFESPEVWHQTLEEIERQHAAGLLNDREYQFASLELQRRLNDPEKFSQYKRRQETAAAERQQHNEEWKRQGPARARKERLGLVATLVVTLVLASANLILLGAVAWDVRREWRAGLWRWFLIATPFFVLSLLDAAWLLLHPPPPGMTFPPKSESMVFGLILIWSFYPGALAWGVLFRWCVEKWRTDVWRRSRALGVFWFSSLLTAPMPFVIHSLIIMENQARGHGPFAHIGEGAMFVLFLPLVSAALSTLVTAGLAGKMTSSVHISSSDLPV